jgi:carbohydrate kinase (thermoresistant glucokinase family)
MTHPKPLLVVMGVSGSGKTTVGQLLADRLAVPFEDADSLHPAVNVEKMAAGIALTDEDREPWLAVVGSHLAAAGTAGLVMACSALKRSYRRAILAAEPGARFVCLEGARDLIQGRLANRYGHFMPASLLDSQFAALEPLGDDEPGVTVELRSDEAPDELVTRAIALLHAGDAAPPRDV